MYIVYVGQENYFFYSACQYIRRILAELLYKYLLCFGYIKTDLISLLVCIMIFILVMGTTLCPRTHKPNGLCLWNCEHSSTVGVFMLLWWPALMNAVRLPLQCYQHGQTNVLRHWSEPKKRLVCLCWHLCSTLHELFVCWTWVTTGTETFLDVGNICFHSEFPLR